MGLIRFYRGAASCALFALFGAGALLMAPLMVVLRKPERCQPIVRAVWRPMVWLFVATGLVRVERGNLPRAPRGIVFAANHPSLVDVVFLCAFLPRTLYVAKHALKGNPFLSAVVRATSLPDDARLPAAAAPYLAKGWNVQVFPEGTRTPLDGCPKPFRRGAAQLALRTGAPLAAVGISFSRRLLAKRQKPWDMGDRRVTVRFACDAPAAVAAVPGESVHAAAVRVTAELAARVRGLL